MVNSYFSVPLATLQVAAVPNHTVPEDAFAMHVLPFLTTKMCGLYGIVQEDFHELHVLATKTAQEEERRNQRNYLFDEDIPRDVEEVRKEGEI